MHKKRTKKRIALLLFFLAAIALIWYFNNFTIKTEYTVIYSDKVNNDVKIALISDLHGMNFGEDNSYLIEKINAESPDLIIAAGDMMTTGDDESKQTALKLLGTLADNYPTYFVDGEHDKQSQSFHDALEQTNVICTPMYDKDNYYNISCFEDTLTVGQTDIFVCGVSYYVSFYFDMNDYVDKPNDIFSIFVCHIPQIEEFEKFGADLTLSGDTHGGIIRLLGPAYFEGEWFPEVTSDIPIYDKGLFEYQGGNMYVTPGLGAYPVPARFNNRPELSIITLKPQEN